MSPITPGPRSCDNGKAPNDPPCENERTGLNLSRCCRLRAGETPFTAGNNDEIYEFAFCMSNPRTNRRAGFVSYQHRRSRKNFPPHLTSHDRGRHGSGHSCCCSDGAGCTEPLRPSCRHPRHRPAKTRHTCTSNHRTPVRLPGGPSTLMIPSEGGGGEFVRDALIPPYDVRICFS